MEKIFSISKNDKGLIENSFKLITTSQNSGQVRKADKMQEKKSHKGKSRNYHFLPGAFVLCICRAAKIGMLNTEKN